MKLYLGCRRDKEGEDVDDNGDHCSQWTREQTIKTAKKSIRN